MNSNPKAFALHSCRMEKRAQSDASGCSFSQRGSHFDAGHYFKSSVHGSFRQFSLRCAAFFGALDDDEIFIIEGSCQFISIGCCHGHRCVRSRQKQPQHQPQPQQQPQPHTTTQPHNHTTTQPHNHNNHTTTTTTTTTTARALFRAILVNITSVWGGSPTPRSPHHRARLLGVCAVRRSRFPVGGMSSPHGRYRGGGWGDGGRRGGGGGIFKVGGAGGFFSSVVDVLVIISDKLQQCPRFSSSTVVGPSCCATETCSHSAVQKTGEIPQVVFLDTVEMPVVVQRQVLGL